MLLCLGACQDVDKEAGLTGNHSVVSLRYEEHGDYPGFKIVQSIDKNGRVSFLAETQMGSRVTHRAQKHYAGAFRQSAIELRDWRVPAGEKNVIPNKCELHDFDRYPIWHMIVWVYSDDREGKLYVKECAGAPIERLRVAMQSFKDRLPTRQWEEEIFHLP